MSTLRQSIKRAWKAWTRLAHKIGSFQARVLLTVIYTIFVFPFGIAVRLFSDPLRIEKRPARWLDRTDHANDMQWAHRHSSWPPARGSALLPRA